MGNLIGNSAIESRSSTASGRCPEIVQAIFNTDPPAWSAASGDSLLAMAVENGRARAQGRVVNGDRVAILLKAVGAHSGMRFGKINVGLLVNVVD